MNRNHYLKNRLSAESKLLFLLSRTHPGQGTLEEAQALINKGLNWEGFISLSMQHGTAAIVYKNLPELRSVPVVVCERLRGIYHNSLKFNILMISELDRIIDRLEGARIDVISLKGASASENIFGDIGLYPSSDIDILVKIENIDTVMKILESDGYRLNDMGFDEYREFFINNRYHVSLSNAQFSVEPHWNLFMRYFRTPPEFWWEENITVPSENRTYRFLSPEKNILYNSFRLFSHAFNFLRFLTLISEIIRYYHAEINWEKLFAYAKRLHFENVLSVVLRLSANLLGSPVPVKYLHQRNARCRIFYKYAIRLLMRNDSYNNNANTLFKMILVFLSKDLFGAIVIFVRHIFPPMGDIVSRYRVPAGSLRAVGYYLLNPVFLFKKRGHEKGW